MQYKSYIKHTPNVKSNGDVKVIAMIIGLTSTGDRYEEYKVLTYRDKIKCFIEWAYNSKGEFVSVTYNDISKNQPHGYPMVTHWDYLKEISFSQNREIIF